MTDPALDLIILACNGIFLGPCGHLGGTSLSASSIRRPLNNLPILQDILHHVAAVEIRPMDTPIIPLFTFSYPTPLIYSITLRPLLLLPPTRAPRNL